MRKALLVLFVFFTSATAFAQFNTDNLPHNLTQEEIDNARNHVFAVSNTRGITTPPPFSNLRNMAEWEEIQVLVVAWTSYPTILKQIVANARLECEVVILAENPSATENYLLGNNGGGPFSDLNNVTILDATYDSVWMRDYFANSVYADEVGELFLVDWIYNRPRPEDDASPQYVADYLGIDMYCTTDTPYDLMNTGGNYMTDGFGKAFASELILDENNGTATGWGPMHPDQSETEIDEIFSMYMGIDEYIKMDILPYDGIHHIDMHMKLLDEETLLVGEYPDGISDGPQINANIEYVLSNFQSKWGTNFKVHRIPMPPSTSGNWPSTPWPNTASYRTYTNSVFINKTVLVPTYREEYDTTAMRIYNELLPGYTIVPIDCDNQPDNIISASGALHCITHSVGVNDPLLISHQPLTDTYDDFNPYTVSAYMNHNQGVESAFMYWKTSLTGAYNEVSMSNVGTNTWEANIPAQPIGTRIYCYVHGIAADGKELSRPMPAPNAYWSFDVLTTINVNEVDIASFKPAFPNPAGAITCIPVVMLSSAKGSMTLEDVTGRVVMDIYNGQFPMGESKYFFDASTLSSGAYLIRLQTGNTSVSQRIMVN
jgi:agmatine deiminase